MPGIYNQCGGHISGLYRTKRKHPPCNKTFKATNTGMIKDIFIVTYKRCQNKGSDLC